MVMQNAICWACVILLGVGTLVAQTTPKATVIWSSDPNCDASNSAEVKILNPRCSSVQIETTTFYIIDYDGISYAMTHRPVRDYLIASVQISNKTVLPLEIKAKRARLGRYPTSDDFVENTKAIYVGAESQDDLRQAIYQEGVVGEREGGIRSGLKKRDKYEVDYNRGKYVRRPGAAIDEPEAPPTESPSPYQITSELLIPKMVFDFILKGKTLAPGAKTAGHLVFKQPPEDKSYLVLYLSAGSVEFVFPTVKK